MGLEFNPQIKLDDSSKLSKSSSKSFGINAEFDLLKESKKISKKVQVNNNSKKTIKNFCEHCDDLHNSPESIIAKEVKDKNGKNILVDRTYNPLPGKHELDDIHAKGYKNEIVNDENGVRKECKYKNPSGEVIYQEEYSYKTTENGVEQKTTVVKDKNGKVTGSMVERGPVTEFRDSNGKLLFRMVGDKYYRNGHEISQKEADRLHRKIFPKTAEVSKYLKAVRDEIEEMAKLLNDPKNHKKTNIKA